MNIKRIKILLDLLASDIYDSDETEDNKNASLETIEAIKQELNK